MAVSAAVGQVLLSLGLGKVPAARGTGLSNLQVAFALIYGLAFFHEIPTWVTVGGAVLIIASQVLLARVRPAHLERRHIL
jgi:drug/metabolite transporter (DMT)-like permease